jgi:lincosamide nucleotidyltransferase A/C/D/E
MSDLDGGTRLEEVLDVLADLGRAGCRCWVGGGWGVDALVGRQTRAHRDLDLALDAQGEAAALEVLARRGYRVETDWRPVRVELVSPVGRVDLHPVVFDGTGHGLQAGLDGAVFRYPPGGFRTGLLDGVPVPCLAAEQQLRFRQGYAHRDEDRHDLALLAPLAPGLPSPSWTSGCP